MTLMRLLPFMIGSLIDDCDEYWHCFLLLWDICSLTQKEKGHTLAFVVVSALDSVVWV